MDGKFLLDLFSRQCIGGETEEIRLSTTGTLTGTPQDYEIRYREEDDALHRTESVLHVERGACVTVQRTGDLSSHIVIERNVRHVSQYVTPYGTFMLGVCGLQVSSDVDENGGTLAFQYCTDIDLVPLGEIELQIVLKKPSEE